MPIINIEVRQKVAISPLTHLVCGNSDYQIAFQFDNEWAEHTTKTARFIWVDQYVDVVFQEDICDVPVIMNTNYCAVGVFAGDLRTTTPALISCDKSILCSDGAPADPPPDVYGQIMELLASGGGGIGTEEEVLQLLSDTDMLPAVYNADSKVLTNEAGRIVLRY